MWGIVAVTGYKKALPLLINGLEKLEYRGYDSAGIAVINSETNSITCNKAEGKLKNLINNLNDENIPGPVGIGHTRLATHGKPEVKNAHPHTDSSGNIAVVQNGIIENFQDLKNKLEEEGIIFNSDTDSIIKRGSKDNFYMSHAVKIYDTCIGCTQCVRAVSYTHLTLPTSFLV